MYVIKESYLHVVKAAAAVSLQAHVSEVQGHSFTGRQTDQIDALAVVGVVVGPVGGDDDALALSEGSSTARVA